MLNMHVHMSLLQALLGEHEVSRKLASESPCMQRAVYFGPCRRANKLEVHLQKIRKCALRLRLVKVFLPGFTLSIAVDFALATASEPLVTDLLRVLDPGKKGVREQIWEFRQQLVQQVHHHLPLHLPH